MSKLVELSWVTRLSKNVTAIKELSKEYAINIDELKLNPNIIRYSYQLDGNIPEELLNEIIRHIKEVEYLPLFICLLYTSPSPRD